MHLEQVHIWTRREVLTRGGIGRLHSKVTKLSRLGLLAIVSNGRGAIHTSQGLSCYDSDMWPASQLCAHQWTEKIRGIVASEGTTAAVGAE